MDEFYLGVQLWDFSDVRSLMDEFLELYDKRPVINTMGGMNSAHLFWTWYALRKLNPKEL